MQDDLLCCLGAAFAYAGILWRWRLWIVLLNLNFCFANVMRTTGEGRGQRNGRSAEYSNPASPCVPGMERVGPWNTSLPPPAGCEQQRTQLWQPHLGQLRGWGRAFGAPSPQWPPLVLCMDVRSAEVKHIPVISMTKINLELSKLYLEWCELSYKCNPRGQLGFGAFWSAIEVLLFQARFSLMLLS